MPNISTDVLQAERDALVCLGLLAHTASRFDLPVSYAGESAPSHVAGLNIHAAVVDNGDGEILALDRNTIHSDGSPLQHGEQRTIRTAIARVTVKRPRQPSQAIEGYYRSSMFMGKGSSVDDFLNLGATLYTTLEPCPMCASSLLVCRMKRIVFLIPDQKYGGAWQMLKAKFYAADESQYSQLAVTGKGSQFAETVGALYSRIMVKIDDLRKQNVRDTHFLDFCRDELGEAFQMLQNTKGSDLSSIGAGESRNLTTLAGLQKALNMPYAI
jgi:tRNA(Arg) A34 adenosine deaminase TadA